MQARTSTFRDFAAAVPTDPVARIEALSRFLDDAVRVPGTNLRVGADALVGLIPGIGDVLTTAMSAYIVWEARNLGLPRTALARMVANVAIDAAVGALPLAGDVLDVFWRANRRNLKIVRDHLRRTGRVIDAEYRWVD
jgi:hypothetical protein